MTPNDQQNLAADFLTWWANEAYPQAHAGVVPVPDKRDPRSAARILRAVHWDPSKARAVALEYLQAPVMMIRGSDRSLHLLASQINYWQSWARSSCRNREIARDKQPASA